MALSIDVSPIALYKLFAVNIVWLTSPPLYNDLIKGLFAFCTPSLEIKLSKINALSFRDNVFLFFLDLWLASLTIASKNWPNVVILFRFINERTASASARCLSGLFSNSDLTSFIASVWFSFDWEFISEEKNLKEASLEWTASLPIFIIAIGMCPSGNLPSLHSLSNSSLFFSYVLTALSYWPCDLSLATPAHAAFLLFPLTLNSNPPLTFMSFPFESFTVPVESISDIAVIIGIPSKYDIGLTRSSVVSYPRSVSSSSVIVSGVVLSFNGLTVTVVSPSGVVKFTSSGSIAFISSAIASTSSSVAWIKASPSSCKLNLESPSSASITSSETSSFNGVSCRAFICSLSIAAFAFAGSVLFPSKLFNSNWRSVNASSVGLFKSGLAFSISRWVLSLTFLFWSSTFFPP